MNKKKTMRNARNTKSITHPDKKKAAIRVPQRVSKNESISSQASVSSPSSARDTAQQNSESIKNPATTSHPSSTAPSSSAATENIAQQKHAEAFSYLAKKWLKGFGYVFNILFSGFILFLVGVNSWNQPPLLAPIKRNPIFFGCLGVLLLLLTVLALCNKYFPKRFSSYSFLVPGKQKQATGLKAVVTVMSIVLNVILITMLVVPLFRPSWCPAELCPPPLIITRGTHDPNLDAYFIALQSPSYVIRGDPVRYSQSDLPEQIGAQCVDCKLKSAPYRVVIGVHSLQQGNYGMLIERVNLKLEQVPPIAHPLNVWIGGSHTDYSTNLYNAVYNGQSMGETILAPYASQPYSYVELAPGEADQLDVQVSSQMRADLRFRVQITYRVTNQVEQHTLTLPTVFEVVFSDASNWNGYQLQNGHFEAIG